MDAVQGEQHWLPSELGDFIIRRKDHLFAYQLAVVVDDIFQGITDIVRGADLLDSTPRQLALIQALGAGVPRYAHIPVITGADDQKLSKQTGAVAIDEADVPTTLRHALSALGQSTFDGAQSTHQIIEAAIAAWDRTLIPGSYSMPLVYNDSKSRRP